MKTITLAFLLLSINSFSSTEVISSSVRFVASGKPSFIKARGDMKIKKATITNKNNSISGEFTVDLNELDSGITLRDSHLKENYLEVKKYPVAVLNFENISVSKNNEEKVVNVTLKLHGQEKDIDIVLTTSLTDNLLSLQAEFDLILTDYNIELPSFQGITAAKKVSINVESKVKL